jgi:glyoxylase-like metal-dependent hydrolase (beta-lactamase superfamily II)
MLNPNSVEKAPHLVLPDIFAFAPNRDTLGGTAYLIVNTSGNILIDGPAWHDTNRDFVSSQGGISHLIVTHRGGLGQMATIAKDLAIPVIIQEQEAYLLPETPVITYQDEFQLIDQIQIIWTPGHSPGSACVYYDSVNQQTGQGILFTGRHLLPDRQMNPQPFKTPKTFHWPRQQRSVDKLKQSFPLATYLLPGASSGLLRGRGYIDLRVNGW